MCINSKKEEARKYNHGAFETVDVIEDWELSFNLGSVIKYISRADHGEDSESDLGKALWYLKREIQNRRAIQMAELA